MSAAAQPMMVSQSRDLGPGLGGAQHHEPGSGGPEPQLQALGWSAEQTTLVPWMARRCGAPVPGSGHSSDQAPGDRCPCSDLSSAGRTWWQGLQAALHAEVSAGVDWGVLRSKGCKCPRSERCWGLLLSFSQGTALGAQLLCTGGQGDTGNMLPTLITRLSSVFKLCRFSAAALL